ncbi:hypothetical protein GGI00_006297, partial [Coemansia sp. RSA 2681]
QPQEMFELELYTETETGLLEWMSAVSKVFVTMDLRSFQSPVSSFDALVQRAGNLQPRQGGGSILNRMDKRRVDGGSLSHSPSSYTASATKLTGGLINYVWRLADASGDTVIVKYADSSLAVLPEVKFSVERMDFEVRGLSLFNELSSANQASETLRAINSLSAKSLAPTASVRVPKLLYYDASQHFLILEDVGVHMGYEAWYVSKDSGPADIDF